MPWAIYLEVDVKIFTGFDQREAIGWHVFAQSVIERIDQPVEIIPLSERMGKKLGVGTDGTNVFTKLRFLVPYLCGFKGTALWVDGADMLALSDLTEIWEKQNSWHGVKVVKHHYQTKHPRKYVGTSLEADNLDYEQKNWSSLIWWRCDYLPHQQLTPHFIQAQTGQFLHRFQWMPQDRIGELEGDWNHLVGEQEASKAKIAHYTLGIPGFTHYSSTEYADQWKKTLQNVCEGMQYQITLRGD